MPSCMAWPSWRRLDRASPGVTCYGRPTMANAAASGSTGAGCPRRRRYGRCRRTSHGSAVRGHGGLPNITVVAGLVQNSRKTGRRPPASEKIKRVRLAMCSSPLGRWGAPARRASMPASRRPSQPWSRARNRACLLESGGRRRLWSRRPARRWRRRRWRHNRRGQSTPRLLSGSALGFLGSPLRLMVRLSKHKIPTGRYLFYQNLLSLSNPGRADADGL